MLRGIDPTVTEKALDGIVSRLRARHIQVLLCGMYAAPGLDRGYREQFAAIYPELAKRYGVPLYPFFLAGIIGHPDLHIADGLHPNAAGVAAIVRNILPTVEHALKGLEAKG